MIENQARQIQILLVEDSPTDAKLTVKALVTIGEAAPTVRREWAPVVPETRDAADMADAVVRKRQDALTLRTTQQGVRLDILNGITNVESSKESVKLAKIAQDYAQKALDAENKKYELGTELSQNVLLAQNALAQAASTVVTNQIALRKNLLNLWVKIGTLLDERGIVIQP